ncbi:MAG: citramalate synthase [Planctomycetota bacterium]|nr:citramalate synthase [Planctomycetota bacterium]
MPRIELYDTTLRDGSQGEGVSFSLEDKVQITYRLAEMGFDFIEGGYPLSNPKDSEYFQKIAQCGDPAIRKKVVAFGMTRRRGFRPENDVGMQALIGSGAQTITIVGKSWKLHVTDVLGVDEAENLAMIRDSVAWLISQGRTVFYDAEHFFDGFFDDYENDQGEFALRAIEAAQQAGAERVILCDTNGGRLPDEIALAVRAARARSTVPIGIHCHNDCELAVANSLAAVAAGATQVQGTINGLGERCGNADLISVAANLDLKYWTGAKDPNGDAAKVKKYEVLRPKSGSIKGLTELSHFVYELANVSPRTNQAFVGASAFAHKGGMHAHAVSKIAKSYEHISPGDVGNEQRVLVSELSGRSNIIAKTTKWDIQHNAELMSKILDEVMNKESEGYQYEAAEASFDLLVLKQCGKFSEHFQRRHYMVNFAVQGDPEIGNIVASHPRNSTPGAAPHKWEIPLTNALVKVRVGPEVKNQDGIPLPDEDNPNIVVVGGEGHGPVDALHNALSKALKPKYGKILKRVHLVDYKVRVINSAAATAARVRVIIESTDGKSVWSTVGVSENVIEASWLALVDSLEYKLHNVDRMEWSTESSARRTNG